MISSVDPTAKNQEAIHSAYKNLDERTIKALFQNSRVDLGIDRIKVLELVQEKEDYWFFLGNSDDSSE
jgi:hypothetical protein